jgi:hypothetical protein
MPILTEDLEALAARFWYRVDKESGFIHPVHGKCWEWIGGKTDGRGMMSWQGKMLRAYRVSWILHHGYSTSLQILHKCDNPICVNPDHLFDGTAADNVHDMWAKGRGEPVGNRTKGEDRYNAKLSDLQVLEILIRLTRGELQKNLAEEFGVTQPHISVLKHGKKRKYLTVSNSQ